MELSQANMIADAEEVLGFHLPTEKSLQGYQFSCISVKALEKLMKLIKLLDKTKIIIGVKDDSILLFKSNKESKAMLIVAPIVEGKV